MQSKNLEQIRTVIKMFFNEYYLLALYSENAKGEKILHLDLLKKQKLQKSCSLCAVFLSLLHL